MTTLATALVNWSALGKIILVGLIGGVGLVLVFGLGVYAFERFESARSLGAKILDATVIGLVGVLCVGAVVVGIIAMANPSHSSSSSNEKKKAAAVVQRAD
jgi:zinc transporter ZupT